MLRGISNWVVVTLALITAIPAFAADRDVLDFAAQKNAPAGTKRIVFIADKGTHGGRGNHEFQAGMLYMARRINALFPNAYAVVYTSDKWPKDLSNADSIIVGLNHGGKAAEDPQIKAAVERGAGFMAIHFGVEVNKGKQGDNYLNWMGGYFETFYSVNPTWKANINIIGKHPTANGVKPFEVSDEWYYHMRFRENMEGVTPILSAIPPVNTVHYKEGGKATDRGGNAEVLKSVEAKEPQALAWAYMRKDGGRGFGFTGYHNYVNLANDDFRKTLLNGAAWVSGLEVPETGIPSTTPTKEEMEALLDEAHPAAPKK